MLPYFHNTHAHGVHQGVGAVAVFKIYFTANGGYAKAVAIVADAVYDAFQQVLCFFIVKVTETQEFSAAIGRAPMVKISRWMPPTPVAAPWKGSIARRGGCGIQF